MPLLTKDPYPALLGIEWAYQNDAIINLKRRYEVACPHRARQIDLKVEGTRFVHPIPMYQRPR